MPVLGKRGRQARGRREEREGEEGGEGGRGEGEERTYSGKGAWTEGGTGRCSAPSLPPCLPASLPPFIPPCPVAQHATAAKVSNQCMDRDRFSQFMHTHPLSAPLPSTRTAAHSSSARSSLPRSTSARAQWQASP
eukprot:3357305-Rhodomonas_salina.3